MRPAMFSSLPWRYGIGVSVLVITALACFIFVQQTVNAQQDNAQTMALLARQPRLVEQIRLETWRLATSDDPEIRSEARLALEQAAADFAQVNDTLTQIDGEAVLAEPITAQTAMANLYFQEPINLADQIEQFGMAVTQILLTPDADLSLNHTAVQYVMDQSDGRLAAGVQAALDMQQLLNSGELVRQEQVLLGAIIGMLLAIGLVVAIVIIPIQRMVFSRTSDLLKSNQQLQSQNDAVSNLTRDMELAAEIGQVVTEIQDLDSLLFRAVELVRSRFDLYYAQIYLTDPNRRSLMLRAGTGEVGRALMDRGHRLAIAPDSINGIAAYEKRSLIVSDTEASSAFRPNLLLPETLSEMSVPIIYRDEVIGVLNLQSSVVNGLNTASLPAFEAIAGQLAVAIVNATLFEESQQAQKEMTEQAQRLTEVGWSDFLNAVDRGETVGYVYDQSGLRTLSRRTGQVAPSLNTYASRISIAGTPIGYIQLTADPEMSWNEEQLELVDAISQQVARQLDNIRLLAEADRYREQADSALRRLTGQGWANYAEQRQLSSFVYDGQNVAALPENDDEVATNLPSLVEPLQVRGETIGELAVNESAELASDAPDLIAAVAERLAGHLENLRLSEQTEKALSASEIQAQRLAGLNEFGTALSQAETLEDVLKQAALSANELVGGQLASLALFEPATGTLVIHDLDDDGSASLVQNRIAASGTAMEEVILTGRILNFGDITNSDYRDNVGLRHLDMRSRIIAPLVTQNGVIGTINLGSLVVNDFDQSDARLLTQMASLLAATLENNRLLNDAQRQAQRERMVNQITQKIQGTRTIDGALQTAVEELGRMLKARKATVELGNGVKAVGEPANGAISDSAQE